MHVVKIQYDERKAGEIWPSFCRNIDDKHKGTTGTRFENIAIDLLSYHFPGIQICIDHSEDVVGQLHGIDFTVIKNNPSACFTIDVKGGSTGIYWDRIEKYWYITIKDNFFDDRKINSHFMHIGPKGDLYVIYNKQKLLDLTLDNPSLLIDDRYGKRLKIKDLPKGSSTNIKVY